MIHTADHIHKIILF